MNACPDFSSLRRWVAVLSGCAGALAVQGQGRLAGDSPPAPGRIGLRIEYQTTGVLPGAGPDEKPATVLQRITLDDTGTKLLYEEISGGSGAGGGGGVPGKVGPAGARGGSPSKKVIFRTDGPKPILYEVLDAKSYREHPRDLNEIQKERRLMEENEVLAANQLSAKERAAFFRENPHLRSDGSPEVSLAREAGERTLGYECDRILVTENGRPIVQGLVTREPLGSGGPFQLYRRLGAFSDEVLLKLAKVEGILLRGKIIVVTALRPNELEVEATGIDRVEVSPEIFEVAGLTRVEDVPKDALCGFCGKKIVDPKHPGGKGFYDGKTILFCSEKCAVEYRKEMLKGERTIGK